MTSDFIKNKWLAFLARDLAEFHKERYSKKINCAPYSSPHLKSARLILEEKTYEDSFHGNILMAGREIVFERKVPVWHMQRTGFDQKIESVNLISDAANFLTEVLANPQENIPIRGKQVVTKSNLQYRFTLEQGSLDSYIAKERIYYKHRLALIQTISGGVLIYNDPSSGNKIYPWSKDIDLIRPAGSRRK